MKDAMLLLDEKDDIAELRYWAGILNSDLLKYLYRNHFATVDVLKNALLALPLPRTDLPKARAAIVALVVDLERCAAEASRSGLEIHSRQGGHLIQELNVAVNAAYGLTDAEIRIIEESTT